MRIKQLLTKTLLAAAGLCVGVSAWADKEYTTVWVNDFENAGTYTEGFVIGKSRSSSVGETSQYARTDITSKAYRLYGKSYGTNATYSFSGISVFSADDYKFSMDFALTLPQQTSTAKIEIRDKDNKVLFKTESSLASDPGKNATTLFDSPIYINGSSTAEAENVIVNTYRGGSITFYNVLISSNAEDGTELTLSKYESTGSLTLVKKYTISDGYIQLGAVYGQNSNGNAYGNVYFDNFSLSRYSAVEIVPDPSAEITGVDGSSRTVTMTLGTGSAEGTVIKWYTSLDNEVKTYSAPVTISSTCTIYYYAESTSGAKSSPEQTLNVTCDEITLNAPSVFISGMTQSGVIFNPVLNATSDQSDIFLSPVETVSASFNGNAVSLPYTATEAGTLTVTVSADGYTSKSSSISLTAGAYVVGYQSQDYSAITSENVTTALNESWTDAGSTRWANWNSGKTYQYYQYTGEGATGNGANITTERLRMRDVVLLSIGYGFGRNANENVYLMETKANDIGVVKIYNGFGSSNSTYNRYFILTKTSYPFALPASNMIQQVTYYTPAPTSVSPAVTDYATFSSAYALDFTSATGVKAYYASASDGSAVTMTKVTGAVAAGTALLLQKTDGEISIPVAATGTDLSATNLLKAGTGAAVKTEGTTHRYVLAGEGDATSFYELAESADAVVIPEGKAYLEVVGAGARLALVFSDDETTGIANVEKTSAVAEGIYNLNGQRVAAPQKGLYIVNGKKVIKK